MPAKIPSRSADSGLMPGVNRNAGELMVRLYGGDDPHNPLVNVLGADLHGLPPATVITCGRDGPRGRKRLGAAEALTA